MQLQLLQQHPLRQAQSTGHFTSQSQIKVTFSLSMRATLTSLSPVAATGSVPGRVHLHPQHQRYETAQDLAQHPHKPLRYVELFAVLSNQAWIEVAEGPQDTVSVCQAAKLQKSLQSAPTHKLQILAF